MPKGEICHIAVIEKRLLTPLSEALPNPNAEEFCSTKMDMEPVEDWRIPSIDFLERGRLLDDRP